MSRGYLLFALESNNTNYCRLAYACALSIKLTQPEGYNNVSVITNDRGYFGFKKDIFDQVIPGGLLTPVQILRRKRFIISAR